MDPIKLNISGEKATVISERPNCFIGQCVHAEHLKHDDYTGIGCNAAENTSVFELEECPKGKWWRPNERIWTDEGLSEVGECPATQLCKKTSRNNGING